MHIQILSDLHLEFPGNTLRSIPEPPRRAVKSAWTSSAELPSRRILGRCLSFSREKQTSNTRSSPATTEQA